MLSPPCDAIGEDVRERPHETAIETHAGYVPVADGIASSHVSCVVNSEWKVRCMYMF